MRQYLFSTLKIVFLGVVVSGCTSTNNQNNSPSGSSVQSAPADSFVQLNGQQIRERIISNTLTGRSNNFPQVGPIDFLVYYSPDGMEKDQLTFTRGGNVDRSKGTWRIANEAEGILCSTAAKRNQGIERCGRIFVSDDQFRSVPIETDRKGVTGRIVSGDQVK